MYNLSIDYHWYKDLDKKSEIVKVFKVNGVPYSFDRLPEIERSNPGVFEKANKNKSISSEQMFLSSYYLTAELMHPLLFDLEIDKPELLPQD